MTSKQEISDKEIELNAASYCLTAFNDKLFNAFVSGAKWYREKQSQVYDTKNQTTEPLNIDNFLKSFD